MVLSILKGVFWISTTTLFFCTENDNRVYIVGENNETFCFFHDCAYSFAWIESVPWHRAFAFECEFYRSSNPDLRISSWTQNPKTLSLDSVHPFLDMDIRHGVIMRNVIYAELLNERLSNPVKRLTQDKEEQLLGVCLCELPAPRHLTRSLDEISVRESQTAWDFRILRHPKAKVSFTKTSP